MRLDRLRRFEEGGQSPDPMQILQAYAQANQMDEETFAQFMQEFQSMAPQEQQHVLQVISQQLEQAAQQQAPQGQMPLRDGDEMQQQDPSQNPMVAQLGGMIDNSTYDPYTRSYTLPKAAYGMYDGDPTKMYAEPIPDKKVIKKIVPTPTQRDTTPKRDSIVNKIQADSLEQMEGFIPDTTRKYTTTDSSSTRNQNSQGFNKDDRPEYDTPNELTSNYQKNDNPFSNVLHPLKGNLDPQFYKKYIKELRSIKGLKSAIPIETVKGDLIYYNNKTGEYGAIGLPGRSLKTGIGDLLEIFDPTGASNYGDSRAAKYNRMVSDQTPSSTQGERNWNGFMSNLGKLGNIPAVGKLKPVAKGVIGAAGMLGEVFSAGTKMLREGNIIKNEAATIARIDKAKELLSPLQKSAYEKLESLPDIKKTFTEDSKEYRVARALYSKDKKLIESNVKDLQKQIDIHEKNVGQLKKAISERTADYIPNPHFVDDKQTVKDLMSLVNDKKISIINENKKIEILNKKLADGTVIEGIKTPTLESLRIPGNKIKAINKELSKLPPQEVATLSKFVEENKALIAKFRKIPEGVRPPDDEIAKAFKNINPSIKDHVLKIIKYPYQNTTGNNTRLGAAAVLQYLNQDKTE